MHCLYLTNFTLKPVRVKVVTDLAFPRLRVIRYRGVTRVPAVKLSASNDGLFDRVKEIPGSRCGNVPYQSEGIV